jgi:ATP-binding cassette subfamily C protein
MIMVRWLEPYLPVIRPIRRRASVGMGFAALTAAAEALGLTVLGTAASRGFTTSGETLFVAGGVAGSLLLASVSRALSELQLARAQVGLENHLRQQMTDALLSCDWQDFVGQQGHELQSAVISEAGQVAQATVTLVKGVSALFAGATIFVCAFLVSVPAASICAGLGLVGGLVYTRMTARLHEVQRRLAEEGAEITRHTTVLVGGLRSLRLSPVQAEWRNRLRGVFDSNAESRIRDLSIPVKGRAVVEAMSAGMVLLVLLTQARISDSLLPALVVMALILRVVPRLQVGQQQLSYARHGLAWVQRWNDRTRRLATTGTEGGAGDAVVLPSSSPAGADLHPGDVVLEVKNVAFSYRSHSRPVLDGVDLTLRGGEWVSLRGASGQGKSTLVDVVGGILVPQEGMVFLHGIPVREYRRQDRYRRLAIVPQDVQLLGSSVADVLTWNGAVLPGEPIEHYSRALGIDEMFSFSDACDGGLDEMGRDISAGMKTRLAMARALALSPTVLVLDETTSRLHPEAEAEIFRAVGAMRPDLAVLVITHRAETAMLADRRLRLVDGALVGE